jgi:hypothetical protein
MREVQPTPDCRLPDEVQFLIKMRECVFTFYLSCDVLHEWMQHSFTLVIHQMHKHPQLNLWSFKKSLFPATGLSLRS